MPAIGEAKSLAAPRWSTATSLTTDDGYADLSWSIRGSSTVKFYRLTERFNGQSSVHFVDHPTTRLYRIQPGRYEFWVQACERDSAGYPTCGDLSRRLELVVSDAVDDQQTEPPRDDDPPPGAVRSPAGFTPGRWHNPSREGHGWSFYWKNGLSYPEGHPWYGNAWDLIGIWYTYEARLKYPQNPNNCPGPNCVWVFDEYRPIYAQLNFTYVSAQQAYGTVYIRRSGNNENVGSVTVTFESSGNATVEWDANFEFQHLEGVDAIELLVGPDPDPVDNPSHYSGFWHLPGQNYFVAHALGMYSESVEVLFDDQNGNPSWILAAGDDPVPEQTDLCFFYVAEGFAPGTTGDLVFHENGCDPDIPASQSNRNGSREFTDFESEEFWVNVQLPGGNAPYGFAAGSASYPISLPKALSFHRISYDSASGSSCDAGGGTSPCVVELTWFTDGNYPQTSAFVFKSGSGQPTHIESAMVMEDYTWETTEAGEYVFELRMGNTPDSTLIGVSDVFTVQGGGNPPPGGGGEPETPPDPAGPPDMTPNAASSGTGSTPGSFAVLPTGGATYRVPIQVAPGSGGLAPAMALVYDSQAGNGPVGVGWGIDGFSVISRCAQTIEQDGEPALQRITFGPQDRFCLDGERLMAINGAYGANGTEYRKERDDHTRVISYGSGSHGPSYFKAWSRDGVESEFGATPDSRIETRGAGIENVAYAWAQNRIQDTAGNYMTYQYSEAASGPVDFVLDKILYTGNVNAGTQPYAEVDLIYGTGRSDSQTAYMAGVAASHSRLLQRIDSRGSADPGQPLEYLRRYILDYGQDGWGRATLESLTECSDASESICFEPTSFGWLKSEHEISAFGPDVSTLFTADFRGLAIGDSTGDGRADLLITERDGQGFDFGIATGNASGSFTMGAQRFDLPAGDRPETPVALTMIDLNADGFQDVVYVRKTAGTVNWHARLAGPTGLGTEFVIVENCCNLLSPSLLQVMDFNGDGLSDIMTHRPEAAFEEASEIVVLINEFQPGDEIPSFGAPIVIDVNYPDLFPASTPTGWQVADEAPGFAFQTGRPWHGTVEDFYGDGSVDILVRLSRLYVRCANPPCTPDGAEAPGTSGQSIFIIEEPNGPRRALPGGPDPHEEWALVTFYLVFFADESGQYSTYEVVAKGAGDDCGVSEVCSPHFQLPAVSRTLPADINADGLADVAYLDESTNWFGRLNTGEGFLEREFIARPPDVERAELARLIDITGDGYPELCYPDQLESDHASWTVHDNNLGLGFSGPRPSGMPFGNSLHGDQSIMLDFTSDGIVDQLVIDWRSDGNGAETGSTRVRRGVNLFTQQTGQAANVIETIESGLGAVTGIDYLPLTDPDAHTRLRDSTNAVWGSGSAVYDLSVPYYAVSAVETSSPVYGNPNHTSARHYHYAGAKVQAGGRGFLGFAEVVEWDPQVQLRTNTRYRQDFPFTGLVADTSVFSSNSSNRFDLITDISQSSPAEWTTIGAMTTLESSAHGVLVRYLIHEWEAVESGFGEGAWSVRSTAELNREYGLDGSFRHKTFTTREFDGLGNILVGEERRYAVDGTGYWSRIVTDNDWINDTSRWRLGRLDSTEVSHWRAGAGPAIVRTSSYGYHPQSDLLERETAEPGHPSREVVTEYTLDSFGNRIETKVAGIDMAPRESAAAYDVLGRFVVEAHNVYGQVAHSVADWDQWGNPKETYNIDGILTLTANDHMGRPFASFVETGQWTRTDHGTGGHAQCPSGTAYHTTNSGGGIGLSVACFDRLGREFRSVAEGFNGGWVYTDTYFDHSGRPERLSEPYFANQARFWNTTQYDGLGRVTNTTAANGLYQQISYDTQAVHCGQTGARARLTRTHPGDGTIRDRWERENVAGETERILDDSCGEVSHAYDAVGNLVETVGIDGAVVAIDYDPLGLHKVQMDDPDKGLWQYETNALGEVTRQLDSKQQAIDFEYDLMGRVVHRRELTGVSSLGDPYYQTRHHEIRTWQNSAGPGITGRGQIISEAYREGESGEKVHERVLTHDGFGRVIRVDHKLEGETFVETTTYDEFGRVFQKFDASGDSRGVRFVYNTHGYLKKLKEAREGVEGVVYQEILAMDARGNPSAVKLGNGTEVYAEFDPTSGHAKVLEAYGADGAELQFVEYKFDKLGNLEWRRDRSGSNDLREDFDYDLLDRLESVMLTAPQLGLSLDETQALSYDASGNITYKLGVGAYTYGQGSAGPHAVTRAGAITYTYDASGNQVWSSDGRSIEYSVFDKPTRIEKGLNFTEFSYGLGNRRYKRVDDNGVDGDKTTWTIGNVERIQEGNAQPYFKRHIGGVAIVDFHPSTNQSDAWYLVKDHLGSVHSISNENGQKVLESHFDAWGIRQGADWQTPLAGAALAAVNGFTTRGFTGHEHADGFGVIHMNGRIYDPRLGRFLQADPFVQAPMNGQSLNRYTYALNNPLSYTDPSGYFLKRLIRKWGRVIVAAAAAYFTWGASYGWAATAVASGTQGSLAFAQFVNAVGWQALAGVAAGAASGFVAGAIISGSLRGAVKSAFAGAITGGIVGHFGDTYNASRVLADTVAGGVTSEIYGQNFKDGLMIDALTSIATYVNVRFREYQVRNSSEFPAQVGQSRGFRGIRGKIAGERIFEDIWEESGAAEAYANGMPLEEAFEMYRLARLNEGMVSPLGCFQFGPGCVFGLKYEPNGLIDYVLEGYAGVHDGLNSLWFYNGNGTNTWSSNLLVKTIGRVVNVSNVLLATPIVVPSLVPDYMRHLYFSEHAR